MKQKFIAALMLAFCATLFSFSTFGVDHFEIYLNKKLVLKHFFIQKAGLETLKLQQSDGDAQLDIFYNHCGRLGNERTIMIKDEKNNVLKQWRFTDGNNKFMSCKVKDILKLQKNSKHTLQLFYSSKEIPEGKLLAAISAEAGSNKTTP